jgi:cellulose biosynthesis protein BcsQ
MVYRINKVVQNGRPQGAKVTTPIRFDDSLPAFAALVKSAWGEAALANNLFLRDASGQLTFVMLRDVPPPEERTSFAARAVSELGAYVDKDGFAVATPDELFDDRHKDIESGIKLKVSHDLFKGTVNLVDRRMVGGDWLRSPMPASGRPARFVFASVKGGVGRSTALCVLAAELASKGRRVLAIDMDLEAPGLGNLLLPDDTLPEFGLLDYLVELEKGGNTLDEEFLADLVGYSWVGGGRGRVDVIPAIGKRSLRNPENVLAKLARAYLAGYGPRGETLTFSDHIAALVGKFADPPRYDVILVDARAGLHETTAAAVIGLGAEVLLFSLDQPQAFEGYKLLFANLGILPVNTSDDWQFRLHIIQAKAPIDPKQRAGFAERMESLRDQYLSHPPVQLAMDVDPSSLKDTFDVEWSGESSSAEEILPETEMPTTLAIRDDDRFRFFDPATDRNILATPAYSDSFGELIEMASGIVDACVDGAERS